MKSTYDPWDPEVMADPYPYYTSLRADGGCHELADLDMWVLSTYELVSGALRDHRAFSSVGGVSREPSDEPARWIGEDRPGHTATRAMAAPVFRRSAMSAHEATVRLSAEECIEHFVEAGGGEIVSELAGPIALAGLCDTLGVPNRRPGPMSALSEDTFAAISARSRADHVPDRALQLEVGRALSEVIEAQLDREVEDPAASVLDMITAHAHADEDAGSVELDRYGRAEYLTVLVTPGVETTRSMITSAVELAARHPDAWDDVRCRAATPSAFVSEVLRYESPIQGFFRATTRAVEIGEATIPAGARVLCLYGSANRDESAFDEPASFRPGRPDARRHLAYGAGVHRCIGATLAEMEGVAAIEALAARVEGFEVLDATRRTDMAQLRVFARLDVQVTPAS